MKTSRPILVIRFPNEWKIEEVQKAAASLTKTVKDEYFVFTLKCNSVKKVTFETYNVIDAPSIDLDELRKKVLEIQK
jgi:hypothetical protein